MKKIAREKRRQLILVVLMAVVVLGGLWFGLINFQKQNLASLADRRDASQRKLQLVVRTIESADVIESQLGESTKLIAKQEEGMATGDLYSWSINMLRQFKAPYKVEIPQFSQIDGPKDVTLLANFPYKQASLTVGGTAYFYDLGRFIADFENTFPYVRILNLTLEPVSALVGNDREKLSFKMEIAALVKPNA